MHKKHLILEIMTEKNTQKFKTTWIPIIISVFMIVMASLSTYYIGNAKVEEKIAAIEVRVAVLETNQNAILIAVSDLTKELKISNEKNQKLINLLSARWGVAIN